MSDLYSELLVKKERTAKDRLVKGSIIALIVLLVLAGLFIMPPASDRGNCTGSLCLSFYLSRN